MSFCTIGNCTVGYERSQETNQPELCVPCQYGFYQDEKWSLDCKPCPQFQIASILAATSENDCFCELIIKFDSIVSLCCVIPSKTYYFSAFLINTAYDTSLHYYSHLMQTNKNVFQISYSET